MFTTLNKNFINQSLNLAFCDPKRHCTANSQNWVLGILYTPNNFWIRPLKGDKNRGQAVVDYLSNCILKKNIICFWFVIFCGQIKRFCTLSCTSYPKSYPQAGKHIRPPILKGFGEF